MQHLHVNLGLIAVIVTDPGCTPFQDVCDSVLRCIEGYLGVRQRRSEAPWFWFGHGLKDAQDQRTTIVLRPGTHGLMLWSAAAPFCRGTKHIAVALCRDDGSAAHFLRIGAANGVEGAVMVVGSCGPPLSSWLGGHGFIASAQDARCLASRLVRWNCVGRSVCARRLWVAWAASVGVGS
jgi:hypothetical protein